MAERTASSKEKRLFLGTFLPPESRQMLSLLRTFDDRLSASWDNRLRWVAVEKLHLTWLFMGMVDAGRIADLKLAIASILSEQKAVRICYKRALLWPNSHEARHFVLVPDMVPEDVQDLAERFAQELVDYTERPQLSRYRPHVTVLNMESKQRKLAIPDWLGVDEMLPLEHSIEQIDLIESHIGTNKSYEPLASFALCS